jgi:hypothetical protein
VRRRKEKEGRKEGKKKAELKQRSSRGATTKGLWDEVWKGWENRLNVGAKMWSSKKQVASGTGERRNFF